MYRFRFVVFIANVVPLPALPVNYGVQAQIF